MATQELTLKEALAYWSKGQRVQLHPATILGSIGAKA
jgi:hypothetical protein